jgi:RHS repeat-associated protein
VILFGTTLQRADDFYQFTNSPGAWGGLVSAYEPSFGSSQFYAFDQSGNTRVATHKPGDVTSTVDYTAFGTEYYLTGGSNLPFRFGGKWGYYMPGIPIWILYIQQRWLDVALAQWTSRDLIGFNGGDWDLYRYVGNNPVRRSDPSGLDDCIKFRDLPCDLAKKMTECFEKWPSDKDLKECFLDSFEDQACELAMTWFVCKYQFRGTDPCEDPEAKIYETPCELCCSSKSSICILCAKGNVFAIDSCVRPEADCMKSCGKLPFV